MQANQISVFITDLLYSASLSWQEDTDSRNSLTPSPSRASVSVASGWCARGGFGGG